ncbi:hypothetical protein C6341_g19240 [Phytophthora cactorum]|nr:hypothetical protein C6341_g19240 [Phytophthora cactorum]
MTGASYFGNDEEGKFPPPKEFHASWEEWDSYRARYLKGICTRTIVKESESAIKRNRQLQCRSASPDGLPVFSDLFNS